MNNKAPIALPLRYDGQEHHGDAGGTYREILDANGDAIIGEFGSISHEHAQFIVTACNAHDDLVDTLLQIVKYGYEKSEEVQMARAALAKAGVTP